MKTTCQHCGAPMQSQRATKKYCSEQCKQQAFYLRSGLQLSGSVNSNLQSIPFEEEEDVEEQQPEIYSDPEKNKQPATISAPGPDFEMEFSQLIELVIEYTNNTTAHELFRHPERHWSLISREYVAWVNLRWRSILETILQCAATSSIKASRLLAINTAMQQMQQAAAFRYLPANYPFSNEIKELSSRMEILTAGMKPKEHIQYRLMLSRKAIIIGMRYLVAGAVPYVPLEQLAFDK